MTRIEAKHNTVLNQYLREARKDGFYCYYELKQTVKDNFVFSGIRVGQDEGLPVLAKHGLVWKWSDEDSRTKPVDGASLPPLPAYLIIKFSDGFYFIDYFKILDMKIKGSFGITKKRAKELADRIVLI